MSDDDLGIKPEWREAWAQAQYWREAAKTVGDVVSVDLADLSLHLCARLLESEFRREHEEYLSSIPTAPDKCCSECGQRSNWDPRHDYDWPKWIEAAKGVLGG